jgi:hypothetical protein
MNYIMVTDLSGNLKGVLHPLDSEIEKTKKALQEFGFRVFKAEKKDVEKLAGYEHICASSRKNPAPILLARVAMLAPSALKIAKSAVKNAPKALKKAKKGLKKSGEFLVLAEITKGIIKKGKGVRSLEDAQALIKESQGALSKAEAIAKNPSRKYRRRGRR